MLKKIITLCISAAAICLLGGCNIVPSTGSGTSVYSSNSSESSTTETKQNSSPGNSVVTLPNNDGDTNSNGQDVSQTDSGILIAYFSWSGHTKQIANEIQNLTGGDVFEIIPATPYTDDINELSGIASREQRDNARPALASHINDIGKYNIVFIGYPNWWNNMPMPIFTFLEEYDFSGKTVIPFTSYGNGIWGKSINSLKETLPISMIEDGLAVQENKFDTMPQEVSDWILGLDIIG